MISPILAYTSVYRLSMDWNEYFIFFSEYFVLGILLDFPGLVGCTTRDMSGPRTSFCPAFGALHLTNAFPLLAAEGDGKKNSISEESEKYQ